MTDSKITRPRRHDLATWLMLAAVVVAILAAVLPLPPWGGLSFLAVVLATLSIARRAVEYHRSQKAAEPEGNNP